MGTKVFVTGGAGVIGKQLIPMLKERGCEIFVGDLKPKPIEFGDEIDYRQGDLVTLTQAEFDEFAPDVMIHLAATFERSVESIEFYDDNFHNNLELSHRLMGLARESTTLSRVLYASSYLVYDSAQYLFDNPAPEAISLNPERHLNPRNLIGMAKLAHEAELKYMAQFASTRFEIVIARIYRGYGLGSRDVISRWVRSLLAGEPISVFKDQGMFDYIYCKDSAEGVVRLALDTNYAGIVDLGTGKSKRVADVVSTLRAHFPNIEATFDDSDIQFEASQADTTQLQKILGWTPQYSVETAIPEIIGYESARLDTSESE
jgi:carbamoyl-phosphate synthase large subunit